MNHRDASRLPAKPPMTRRGSNTYGTTTATASNLPSAATTYSRDALDRDLVEGFRGQQKAARDRQVEHLTLAKGLGELAVASLKEGTYHPRKALPPLKPEEKKMFERMDLKDWRTARQAGFGGKEKEDKDRTSALNAATISAEVDTHEGAAEVEAEDEEDDAARAAVMTSSLASSASSEELRENCPGDLGTFLKHLRSTHRATNSFSDGRVEVEENINIVEEALSHQCSPLDFATLLDAISRALEVMERGHLDEDLCVPDCHEVEEEEGKRAEEGAQDHVKDHVSPSPAAAAKAGSTTAPSPSTVASKVENIVLHGALEVEAYTRECLLPKAYKAIAIAHSAEWMLQYTMAFMRTAEAVDATEAEKRLVLLGRCVRLLGDTENFSSVLLSLEAKSEEYAGFVALKEIAETHLWSMLDEAESSLDAILGLPFPARRSRLLLIEWGMQKKLQRALLLLNEIDYSWTPTAYFHWAWKVQFISSTFQRIHGGIAHKYMRCSMGFIDDSLYDQVTDTRITGRYMGASPIQPKVARARQVEYEKVTEGLTLQQIGMTVKGVASLVVGEQVCMGARYMVRQSTKDFDAAWGFHMDEVSNAPTEEDLQKKVAKLAAKAKLQYTGRAARERTQPSTTFLTQEQ
ncbi:hypothetical protein ABB37_03477 [Leptomonas pyrrhocoris]|uniref:Uncharacterized protein n=1 Tax=Leptomonas pyrrhocoris TaxID=157538 RepID=A0A0N0VFY7_LEPPY|nr:hypothetical protein ABB37_03477 [Leptomonas pyrrhocoris]KPA82401.1 hypothetical protein ABB37_03477 [Leptomonas pyrrhocoris]|eukprot:XP_015660840.1 hypothetical protein ABB37_03477 [Leptomonas pyrrhocoris]